MKQNSRILFHGMRKLLINSYLHKSKRAASAFALLLFCVFGSVAMAADKPEYLASFDPAKGFKPAQSDLTEIFLQIAGSLEHYGSPEPYLRHMKAERERMEAKYRQRFDGASKAYWPVYVDDVYFERVGANWKLLEPKLKLESLAKNTGHLIRDAINRDRRNGGATLTGILNQHQARVRTAMIGKGIETADFDALKAELTLRLGLDKAVAHKENTSLAQSTALDCVNAVRADFARRFAALDAGLKPADAEHIKAVLSSLCTDVGRMAEAELETAIAEQALDQTTEAYGPEQETALNAQEKKTFAGFLSKKRFTRSDFSALERFYSTAYDKLSERGKDEMSQRIQAGMRPAR
jgi:hypothetical protein